MGKICKKCFCIGKRFGGIFFGGNFKCTPLLGKKSINASCVHFFPTKKRSIFCISKKMTYYHNYHNKIMKKTAKKRMVLEQISTVKENRIIIYRDGFGL